MIGTLLALALASNSFLPDRTVPTYMAAAHCGGKNISPELHWSGAPAGTQSYALIVHDPDAPIPGGFYHWVLYDIPSTQSEIQVNAGRGYRGPCPPPGKVHHYRFTLYALDVKNIGAAGLDAKQLLARMRGHILAQTSLVGLYEINRPRS